MAIVEYRIDLRARHAHLYDVEARFPVGNGDVDLILPVWTPGSYLVREFERHVQELTCSSPEGKPLPVRKLDKATWRVDARGAAAVVARYRVYANELTVRSAHLDDSHGFFNGACVFLYHPPLVGAAARVRVEPPDGWRVTVGLPEDGAAANVFVARDYDQLVDSPFEVGSHELHAFTAQGRPHRVAIWGEAAIARDTLVDDMRKIVDGAAAVFGDGVPYDAYTFLILLAPNQYGGLEHQQSCTLLASPFTFHPRKKYEEFLELVSHEYFHLWNVKRIHPEVLGPFDYQREAYTRCLWVMEGITSYYDRHLLVRAGIQKPEKYLEKLAEELGKIATTPGRKRQSLEEASFDAWIKFYRPDENSINSTISYYLKGGVVALLLDLEIRSRTGGNKSLDDFMRLLWERFGKRNIGFPDDSVQALAEEASGLDLEAFFERHVRGRDDLEVERLLATVGLTVEPDRGDEEELEPWLGITTRDDHGAVVVAAVLEDGPAQAGGLYAGDELVALDGFRIDSVGFKERLTAKKAGVPLRFDLFRRDQLRAVEITPAARPVEKFKIKPARAATTAEKALYEGWLGAPLPPPGEDEDD
jgi:predicted metalloprotease with PDZ domain